MTAPPTGTSAATLAEGALVGALIWDPRRAEDVSRWLRPTDFTSFVDGRMYEAILGMIADGRADGLVGALPGVLARWEYSEGFPPHQEHGHVEWMMRVDERLRATPAPPPSGVARLPEKYADRLGLPTVVETTGPRSEHVRYAQMVLENATRRDVLQMGVQIGAAAERSLGDLNEAAPTLSAMLEQTSTRLDQLASRLAVAADSRISQALSPGQRSRVTGARWPHEVGEPAARPLTRKALERAEIETIAGALAVPELRRELVNRLESGDFSMDTAGATWDALVALHDRGDPLDYVTLAWEAERRAPISGPGLPPDLLLRLGLAETSPEAWGASEIVSRAALIAHTKAAQQEVQEAAMHPASTARQLVDAARSAYRGAGEHARRLSGGQSTTLDPNPDPRPALRRARSEVAPRSR